MRAVAILSVVVALGALSFAGPLTPPAGPVAPTMKTLDAVEPRIEINAVNTPGDGFAIYRITEPGSYYLSGNLVGEVGKHGILVLANGVSIDLMGFGLLGVPGSVDGITMSSFREGFSVCNGIVSGWGGAGLDLLADNARVTGIAANRNLGGGILNAGAFACVVSDCSVYGNGSTGIALGSGSTIERCSSQVNAGNGITVGRSSTVIGCSVTDNQAIGISTLAATVVKDCVVSGSGTIGIDGSEEARIEGCTVTSSGTHCIAVSEDCVVIGNLCTGRNSFSLNGNIFVDGGGNRLENNVSVGGGLGYEITGTGNILIGNSSRENTTGWSVSAGNACRVYAVPTSGAFVGSSGGTQLTTDPHANFTY